MKVKSLACYIPAEFCDTWELILCTSKMKQPVKVLNLALFWIIKTKIEVIAESGQILGEMIMLRI